MTAAEPQEPHVRFKPSKVEGFPGAQEIGVYPDRLRVLADGRWHDVHFSDIAVPKEPTWVSRLKRRLGARPYRPHVGELFYVRDPYAESYIRFYRKPRLTVYMPADGPAEYPHSHFWKVQEVLRHGGYAADDVDPDREYRQRDLARRPRWLRAAGRGLFVVAMLNFAAWAAGALYFGGVASKVEDGKYYLTEKGKGHREVSREVSREVWFYSRVHTRLTWVLLPLGVAGFFLAHGSLVFTTRREAYERAHRSVAYGPPR